MCICVHNVLLCVFVCVCSNFDSLDLAAVPHRRASVPRQHQGATGVFNMQTIADQCGQSLRCTLL